MRKFEKKLSWIFLIGLFSIAVAGVAINRTYSHAGKIWI
jgi:hypothetical protein